MPLSSGSQPESRKDGYEHVFLRKILSKVKSRLYTRTGDDGSTSLVGGARAQKDSLRLEAYGTVDELNSWLGLIAASTAILPERRELLHEIQNRLFDIGAILATEPASSWQPAPIPDDAIVQIENAIDQIDASLPPLRQFIIPGGHPAAAKTHITRTVARRAERRIISLNREEAVQPNVIKYINRLSDLLFALAREINCATNSYEQTWKSQS